MGATGYGKMSESQDYSQDPVLEALRKAAYTIGERHVEFGVFFGSTDSRFIRRWHRLAGVDATPIKAINFSPMSDTPVLLHDHDEFISKQVFLNGITLFKHFIAELTSFEDI